MTEIIIAAFIFFGLFCFGGMWAGAWIKRNAAEFRVVGVE